MEFGKVTWILEQPWKYWDIGLPFYYISRFQNIPPRVTNLSINLIAKMWHLKLENSRNWETCLSFYYIQRSWNALFWVTHLNISQTTAIWSLKLEKIRSLCKKLMESQKVIKIKNPSKSVKKPQSGLWNWKTLEIFERN